MNIEKTCSACNGYGLDPRCPICNQAKQSAFLRDVGVFKPLPLTERNTAVSPAPTFSDGMTDEDDKAFNRQWDATRFCKNCHGQTGGEVDICEGPHVVGQRWIDCPACGGTGLAPSNVRSEGVPAFSALPSTEGLCGNSSEVGAGETAVESAPERDIHAELTLAAFHREVAK